MPSIPVGHYLQLDQPSPSLVHVFRDGRLFDYPQDSPQPPFPTTRPLLLIDHRLDGQKPIRDLPVCSACISTKNSAFLEGLSPFLLS